MNPCPRARTRTVLLSVCALLLAATVSILAHETATHRRTCHNIAIPVSLSPDQPADQRVAARYCQPTWWTGEHTVDVLTDGATYTHFWDWPTQPATATTPMVSYSIVEQILTDGRATLTYDRLGTGESSKLPSTSVTLTSEAWVLEQLLRWLHQHGYQHINSWGHSYGSGVAIAHAATPGATPLDDLVITGLLHTQRDVANSPPIHPANQDEPQWRIRDDGWGTTMPGSRGRFFHGPMASQAVIDQDEQRKDVVSGTAFGQFLAERTAPPESNPAARITTRVILVVGWNDGLFCHLLNCYDLAAVRAFETPYYSSAANLALVFSPAGHSWALDPSAATTYQDIMDVLCCSPNGSDAQRPHAEGVAVSEGGLWMLSTSRPV